MRAVPPLAPRESFALDNQHHLPTDCSIASNTGSSADAGSAMPTGLALKQRDVPQCARRIISPVEVGRPPPRTPAEPRVGGVSDGLTIRSIVSCQGLRRGVPIPALQRLGRWPCRWSPEDPAFWESTAPTEPSRSTRSSRRRRDRRRGDDRVAPPGRVELRDVLT